MLRQAIQGISDLILVPGLINLDFADVKTIMSGMGVAMMGTGMAEGEDRAMEAAQRAIASPLLEDSSVNGARGVIINVTGGPDLSLMEVNEASCVIQEAAHEDANIIFGAVVDPALVRQGQDHRDRHRLRPQEQPRARHGGTVQTPVDSAATAHLQQARSAEVPSWRQSGPTASSPRAPWSRRGRQCVVSRAGADRSSMTGMRAGPADLRSRQESGLDTARRRAGVPAPPELRRSGSTLRAASRPPGAHGGGD